MRIVNKKSPDRYINGKSIGLMDCVNVIDNKSARFPLGSRD